jgi:Zn-dependent protease with chaperone function
MQTIKPEQHAAEPNLLKKAIYVERWPSELPLLGLVIIASIGIWILLIVSIIGITYGLMLMLFFFLMHLSFIAHIRGNGVKLSPEQLPELYARVKELSERAGLHKMPEVYLIQAGGALNALATKLFKSRMVILYTDLLDACGEDESARDMIIGHELGHIAAGHLDWVGIIVPGMIVPFLGSAYSRAREYTCDRYGAALTADREGMLRGLAILAAGANYAKKVNLQGLVEQKRDLNTGWMTLAKWMMSHPPLCDRLAVLEPSLSQRVPSMHAGVVRAFALLLLAAALPLAGMTLAVYKYWPQIREAIDQARNQAVTAQPVPAAAEIEAKKRQAIADFETIAAAIQENHKKKAALPQKREDLSVVWARLRPNTAEPSDPFDGYLYGYSSKGSDFYLWSSGPDGKNDTEDDLVYQGHVE